MATEAGVWLLDYWENFTDKSLAQTELNNITSDMTL